METCAWSKRPGLMCCNCDQNAVFTLSNSVASSFCLFFLSFFFFFFSLSVFFFFVRKNYESVSFLLQLIQERSSIRAGHIFMQIQQPSFQPPNSFLQMMCHYNEVYLNKFNTSLIKLESIFKGHAPNRDHCTELIKVLA